MSKNQHQHQPASRRPVRALLISLRISLLLTLLFGVVYPLATTGVAQLVFPWQANGSMLTDGEGVPVGSALLGQRFTDTDGSPLAQYAQPRPSAAGAGYDGTASGGSNLGPESARLAKLISERKREVAKFNGVTEASVPPDAVTASGSGLDPDISPAYARLQAGRIASARGIAKETVLALIDEATSGRDLMVLGEPRVNVLRLNLLLDARAAVAAVSSAR